MALPSALNRKYVMAGNISVTSKSQQNNLSNFRDTCSADARLASHHQTPWTILDLNLILLFDLRRFFLLWVRHTCWHSDFSIDGFVVRNWCSVSPISVWWLGMDIGVCARRWSRRREMFFSVLSSLFISVVLILNSAGKVCGQSSDTCDWVGRWVDMFITKRK